MAAILLPISNIVLLGHSNPARIMVLMAVVAAVDTRAVVVGAEPAKVATTASLIMAGLRIMEVRKEAPREATTRPRSARILTMATAIMEKSAPTPMVTRISENQQGALAPRAIAGFQLEAHLLDPLRPCLLPPSSTRLPTSPWEAMPCWRLVSP